MTKYKKYYGKSKKKIIKTSKVERNFGRVLRKYGIKYKTQYQLSTKFYDYYLPDYNLLIEIDGNYWHGNDKYYKKLNSIQRKAKFNDKQKNYLAKINGYKLLRI